MITISFYQGTLSIVVNSDESFVIQSIPGCKWDHRTECFRLPAFKYHELITILYNKEIPYKDEARKYEILQMDHQLDRKPFQHQKKAIESWNKFRKRGYVVLPTGTGKSFVAILAMLECKRSTAIVVPTIDLMHQWYDNVKNYFPDIPIGLIGGGNYQPASITITTYDSAYIHFDKIGNLFGLVIFDECHHLPGRTYRLGAEFILAPYRLGLSATPERLDGGHHDLNYLIGPCIFRKEINEMAGPYLADYNVVEVTARLSAEERKEYQKNRALYINFLRRNYLQMGRNGWQKFIQVAHRSEEGRRAFVAYRKQKQIAQATPSKLKTLEYLIRKHHNERMLIFTHDNATAYEISLRFLVPVITHQTKIKERKDILQKFSKGIYSIIVTSKVLNEGVDIPSASIGIILSGSASVREHVQRLGRILRKHGDKKATLYEVVTEGTSEESVSQRRREHNAYKRE